MANINKSRKEVKEMNQLKLMFMWLRTKYRILKKPVKLLLYEKDGKKYLTVFHLTIKGEKIKRTFEIVSEVNSKRQPIEFKVRKIDKK